MTRPDRNGVGELTKRERDLLDAYIAFGRHNLVATELGLSTQTVKNRAAGILKVLEVASIGQACVLYDRSRR